MTRARDIADVQDNLGGAVAPFVAGKNFLANGGFDIWQRSTSNASFSVTSQGTYVTADRWKIGAVGTVSLASSQQAANNTGNQYALRYGRVSGQTTAGIVRCEQILETVSSIPLAGKTVTLSFYAKKGADAPSTLTSYFYTGTGTDQTSTYNGFTGAAFTSQSNTVTTTSTKYTFTGTIPSNATQVAILFDYTSTGTAGANEWMQIESVQLELGALPTPFARAGGSIGGELALCQRYYERISAGSNGFNDPIAWGVAASTTQAVVFFPMKVTKRTFTATVDWSSLRTANYNTSGTPNVTTPSAVTATPGGTNIFPLLVTTTGLSTGLPVWLDTTGTTGYLGVSAEL
jgi:hypothetical protein